MALKAILDSLDSIDASLHEHYTEKDGKFVLQIDGIKDHPETQALKSALDRVRGEKKTLQDELDTARDRLEGLPDDFDADAYENLKAQAEGKGGDPSEEVQRVRDQYERKIEAAAKKHGTEIAKRDETIASQKALMDRKVIDGGLSAAMDEANIDPKHKKKLLPYLKSLGKITVEEEDGELIVTVETEMGPVDLGKFVSDWAGSDDGKEYVSKASGLDTPGSDGRRTDANPFSKDNWNKTAQGKMIRDDRAKAERLAKAAGFKSIDQAAGANQPIAA